MPVILKIEHKDGQRTAVWELEEDENSLLNMASLNKTDRDAFPLITNPGRRLEWLAVRALLKEFYPQSPLIEYDKKGKPLLWNQADKISISHSGKMVAIVSHPNRSPGIDIEMIHPRIVKIANRFLNEQERTYLGMQPSLEQLTIVWGAKEVMFKIYEHGGVSFKTDFIVNPFPDKMEGLAEGLIVKDNTTRIIPMEYIKIKDFILVQTNYSGDFRKNADL